LEPNTKMSQVLGTLSYMAPEVLDKSYTFQCDMWSFGVCVFFLLFGVKPFRDPFRNRDDVIIDAIMQGAYQVSDKYWNAVSCEAQDFVKSLLVVDPNVRLTAAQALDHPWIVHNNLERRRPDPIDASEVDALVDFGQTSPLRRANLRLTAWTMTANDQEAVRDAFLDLDVDSSGALSFLELKEVLATQGHLTDDEVLNVFNALQTEQDGQDGHIHYSDFLAAMTPTRIGLHDDLLRATFHRFDVEGDDSVSVENMKKIFGESLNGHDVEELLSDAGLLKERQIFYSDWADFMIRNESANSQQLCTPKSADVLGKTMLHDEDDYQSIPELVEDGYRRIPESVEDDSQGIPELMLPFLSCFCGDRYYQQRVCC